MSRRRATSSVFNQTRRVRRDDLLAVKIVIERAQADHFPFDPEFLVRAVNDNVLRSAFTGHVIFHVFHEFFEIRGRDEVKVGHTDVRHGLAGKIRDFVQKIIEKDLQIVGIGDPRAGTRYLFDSAEKLGSKRRKPPAELPKLLRVSNIDLFMVRTFHGLIIASRGSGHEKKPYILRLL